MSCITEKAKKLFEYERSKTRLDGWFLAQEAEILLQEKYKEICSEIKKASILKEIVNIIPIEISKYNIFVGSQDNGFAQSYALINPSFKVEEFSGYCDPLAVFRDIEPNGEFTKERICTVKNKMEESTYVKMLKETYGDIENYTKEVVFFVEQVTGHLIPDFRYVIKNGLNKMISELNEKEGNGYKAMKIALESVIVLADRYKELAVAQMKTAEGDYKIALEKIIKTLGNIPRNGAENLYEAIQMFLLLWEVMCLEQTPNPFAFSVGNADRIFAPYQGEMDREEMSELFKHFLVFFNVGDRSWAISQNIIIGGKGEKGEDLTCETSYALLDAYYDMNLPQPILSVKLHKNTPDKLYKELGRFFFTPGVLTPSIFNDDTLFEIMGKNGVHKKDLPDISIAGCQEPLIMGKDNGNTTNSWLNLPKILELTLTGGESLISGDKIIEFPQVNLENIRKEFYHNVQLFIDKMVRAANNASIALSNLRVPFLSVFMGGMENGIDVRDTEKQSTKYNGSGCLIHGISVIADSFIAIDKLLSTRPCDKEKLVTALKSNFVGFSQLHEFLVSCHKFGNNIEDVDNEVAEIVSKVADMVSNAKNYLGNPFRPDFSSPSTHLLYGYLVGATPDGRKSREMLGYGVDPLYGEASNGLGFRMLSNMKLPFEKMVGGYASHLGIDPKYFKSNTVEEKGVEFRDKVIRPLFFNELNQNVAPFYLYVNVTTPETLRKVLDNPKKYAPSGVYIMRIHGTFVNFLDLSPAIQQDIIKRLDLKSTRI